MSQTHSLIRAGMTPAERCRYVADLIEANPDHFDMNWYFRAATSDQPEGAVPLLSGDRPDLTACGTAACIAGWAVAVTPPEECGVDEPSIVSLADRLLALGGGGRSEPGRKGLFYTFTLTPPEAAFLLRWHADELDRAS